MVFWSDGGVFKDALYEGYFLHDLSHGLSLG
jgi:hypothetical protein